MRPRIAFIGIEVFLKCRDLSKLNWMALVRSSSSILVRLSEDPGDQRCLVRKFFANKLIGAKPRRR